LKEDLDAQFVVNVFQTVRHTSMNAKEAIGAGN
jgi:hypothetical protein